MAEANLKPCPFCGKLPETRVETRDGMSTYYIVFAVWCRNCNIKQTGTISAYDTFEGTLKAIDKATKQWNSRV